MLQASDVPASSTLISWQGSPKKAMILKTIGAKMPLFLYCIKTKDLVLVYIIHVHTRELKTENPTIIIENLIWKNKNWPIPNCQNSGPEGKEEKPILYDQENSRPSGQRKKTKAFFGSMTSTPIPRNLIFPFQLFRLPKVWPSEKEPVVVATGGSGKQRWEVAVSDRWLAVSNRWPMPSNWRRRRPVTNDWQQQ